MKPGCTSLAESLVANLIDNAIRHDLPGGQAEISTALTPAGAVLAIVHAIASSHGAALTAHARPQGGLDIEVIFP